jgi:Homeodomain-like domain
VLLDSAGLTAEAIATAVDKSLLTVRRWRGLYLAKGVDGLLKDATRPPASGRCRLRRSSGRSI